jgi:hypothetical protein
MLLGESGNGLLIWRRVNLSEVLGVRFHHTNSLETAGDNSLLVGGATEVQVNLSVPKDIHNSNGQ